MLVDRETYEQRNMYGFTVLNWKLKALEGLVNITHLGLGFTLIEDSFAYDEKERIACAADGVRRDFNDGTAVAMNLKSILKNVVKFLNLEYPFPSRAREIADICAVAFQKEKSFEGVNPYLLNHNQIKDDLIFTDYLADDIPGCTAAGACRLKKGGLYWTSINAPGVAIISKKGKLKFKTEDDGEHSFEKNPALEEILKQHGGFNSQEGRRLVRSQYRNTNKEIAYGALTGEPEALNFVHQGYRKIRAGDVVLLFTDGIRRLLFPRPEGQKEPGYVAEKYLAKILNKDTDGLKKLCQRKVKTEGTLIVWYIN